MDSSVLIKRVNKLKRILLNINRPKVFCISMQRTGTTSVGKFFRDFAYDWAGWPADRKNNWSAAWYNGDFEAIFSSLDFKAANAYEDSPWFYPEFYKFLYHRFPKAKFILFTRDPDAWYRSMVKHSGGDILGRAMTHCKVYRRELEYFDRLGNGELDEKNENTIASKKIMKLTNMSDYYKDIYRLHHIEVKEFFSKHSPNSLFVANLEDPEKWIKLGKFLNINVPADYDIHENKSKSEQDSN